MSEGLNHLMGILADSFGYMKQRLLHCITLFKVSGLYCKDAGQYCPIELQSMMEMFFICTLNMVAIQPHMTLEHLNCGWGNSKFLLLINLNLNLNS